VAFGPYGPVPLAPPGAGAGADVLGWLKGLAAAGAAGAVVAAGVLNGEEVLGCAKGLAGAAVTAGAPKGLVAGCC
jgi:hypothetical protein